MEQQKLIGGALGLFTGLPIIYNPSRVINRILPSDIYEDAERAQTRYIEHQQGLLDMRQQIEAQRRGITLDEYKAFMKNHQRILRGAKGLTEVVDTLIPSKQIEPVLGSCTLTERKGLRRREKKKEKF